jgi:alpha-D-ribose 1-methylphosphonate 5-triphosphate synthase subunit PhnG
MRIMTGVEDMVQRTGDGQTQVGYSVVGRSRDRVTLCAVCTVHKETASAYFLICPQNQG